MTPSEFLATFAPACQAAMRKNAGFASVRLAQLVQECGWNVETPKDIDTGRESWNMTGVKGEGPAGCVVSWTKEYDPSNAEADSNGYVTIKAKFRAYHSYEEHIMERDRVFLDWPENYGAYLAAKTPQEACRALEDAPEPYASDKGYSDKLIALIEQFDLGRFDEEVRQSMADKPFVDVNPGDWYFDDLVDLKRMGIVHGKDDGDGNPDNNAFRPNDTITRAEAAHMMRLTIKYITGK